MKLLLPCMCVWEREKVSVCARVRGGQTHTHKHDTNMQTHTTHRPTDPIPPPPAHTQRKTERQKDRKTERHTSKRDRAADVSTTTPPSRPLN